MFKTLAAWWRSRRQPKTPAREGDPTEAEYRAKGLQYGALMPPPGCPVCGTDMVMVRPEELPPNARNGPSMWYCPERGNIQKHPLGAWNGKEDEAD